MKNALVALSLLFVTTFATTARAQQYSGWDGVAYKIGGGIAMSSVSASLAVTSLVLDGIILSRLSDGRLNRSVLITNLVFSLIAAGVNAGLMAGSVALTDGKVTALTAFPLSALAVNAGSAIFSGLMLRSHAPVTVTPMVLNDGAGASLSLRW